MTPRLAVRLASLVYQPWLVIEARLPEMRVEDFVFLDRKGTQCIVGVHHQEAVVAFRGSDELEDWLFVNFWKLRVPVRPGVGEAHLGFQKGLSHVWGDVEYKLRKSDLDRVSLIGHSQGAAFATLAASRLIPRFARINLWTFGSPRVGNGQFARHVEKHCRVARYVNCADVVPRVPKFGYRHVGEPTYFDYRGRKYVEPPKAFMLFDRLRAYWTAGKCDLGVRHHSIWRYKERIDRCA